jgi:hypothetical protein
VIWKATLAACSLVTHQLRCRRKCEWAGVTGVQPRHDRH